MLTKLAEPWKAPLEQELASRTSLPPEEEGASFRCLATLSFHVAPSKHFMPISLAGTAISSTQRSSRTFVAIFAAVRNESSR